MSTTSVDPYGADGNDAEAIARGRLSERHLADLRASGLSWETIVRAGFHTAGEPRVIGDLLRRRDASRLGACLLIPYHDLDGNRVAGYVRAKPDKPPVSKKETDKPAKYLSPSKLPVRAYFPPGAGAALQDATRPIAITEGEKKTLAMWQAGVAVVGLAGVECWSKRRARGADGRAQGRRELLDELAVLPWRGRVVYLTFDSDVVGNRDVLRAEANLARALADQGAVVKLVRIPPPADRSRDGIDDYLARQTDPAIALQALFGRAIDHQETIRRVEAGQYRILDGRIVRQVLTRDGIVETPLCNFTARIVDEVVRDDGSGEPCINYGVEGERSGGGLLPRSTVSADQFAGMGWPAECWGARTIVYAGNGTRDHLRAAIQMLSDPTRRIVYTHLGWREIDGTWYYLHAGGGIGPGGSNPSICCDPPGPLSRVELPNSWSPRDIRDGVVASLRLTDGRVPDRISFPVVAAVFRAVLGSCDFSVHLAGPSGVFKSELAALAQQHFGSGMDARHLPGSWSSTGNALEGLAFAAKDTLLVVDDFAPSGTAADVQRLNRDAERFLRAQGNNSARLRMTSDARLRAERPPRGLTLSTGEDTPRGQSIRARLMVVELERGDIPVAALTEFQRDAASGLYSQALAGFVAYVASKYGEVRRCLVAERTALRDRFGLAGGHARTPAAVADLALGLRYFLDFAVTTGAISRTQRNDLWQRATAAFLTVCGEQADHIASADPVDLFLRLVRAAVSSGRAHVADTTGSEPEDDPESWGWRSRIVGAGQHEREEWQPQGHRIGWRDGSTVYLEPDGTFAEVQCLAAEQGQCVPLTPRTLHKRLHERRLLSRVEQAAGKTRFCVRATLEGQRREVLCFTAGTIFPAESAPGAPTGDSGPARTGEPGRTAAHECASPIPVCANGAPAAAPVRRPGSREIPGNGGGMAHSAHCQNGKAPATSEAGWSEWE